MTTISQSQIAHSQQPALDQRVFNLEVSFSGLSSRVAHVERTAQNALSEVSSIKTTQEAILETLREMKTSIDKQSEDTTTSVVDKLKPQIDSLSTFIQEREDGNRQFLQQRFSGIDTRLNQLDPQRR